MRLMLKSQFTFWIVGAALITSLLAGACGSAEIQQETHWSSGALKERWTAIETDAGGLVRHGTYESWYASGLVHERGEFDRDEKQGTWTEWYDHPSSTILAQGDYDAGKRNGVWTYWHNPGHAAGHRDHHAGSGEGRGAREAMPVLKVAGYKNGVAHGDWISWHPSGRVADSMHYVDGKLDGEVRVYDAQGRLVSVRSYKRGRPADSESIQIQKSRSRKRPA